MILTARRVLRCGVLAALLLAPQSAAGAITALGDVTPALSAVTQNTRLFIGNESAGAVIVEGDRSIAMRDVFVGGADSGRGTLLVSGTDSNFDAESIYLGLYGRGDMTIAEGGVVQGKSHPHDSAYLGSGPGSSGMVNVLGPGSLWAPSILQIGRYGEGTVEVSAGGEVHSLQTSIGGSDDGRGAAYVDGAGSRLNVDGQLRIGLGSKGELHISNGGHVASGSASLGANFFGQGLVTVRGEGSHWHVADEVNFGGFSESAVNIVQGGKMQSGSLKVLNGVRSVEEGTAAQRVNIDGEGSRWTINADMSVINGFNAMNPSEFTITNGGRFEITGDFSVAAAATVDVNLANNARMTVGNDLILSTSSNTTLGLDESAFSIIDVGLNATLAGELQVTLAHEIALTPSQAFLIISVGDNLSGEFANLAEGAIVGEFGGAQLAITYQGGDGNDVVLQSLGLSGDYDGNGRVTGGDFLAWQRGAPPAADDLDYWAANFGYAPGGPLRSSVVPEPACLGLASLALVLLRSEKRRRIHDCVSFA